MATTDRTATRDERPWALVTGATGGLGQAFADHLAARGHNLVLVGRRAPILEEISDRFATRRGVQVVTMRIDLASGRERRTLLERLGEQEIVVDTLINNAGFGTLGDVAGIGPRRLADEVGVNCQALTELTAALLPAMFAARRGTVINVSSAAAFQPVPGLATYAASKRYVLDFTRALWHETRGTGVRVTAICPGPTDTGFFRAAGDHDGTIPGRRRRPDQVVRTAFRALERHRPVAVDGPVNRAQTALVSVLPDALTSAVADRIFRSGN